MAHTSACCTARESLLARLDVPKLDPAPDTAPERLETGTQNHEGIVGAGAAVDFLASLAEGDGPHAARGAVEASFAELHARGHALVTTLYDGLSRDSRRDRLLARRPTAAHPDRVVRREGSVLG